jgi:hypothetical protein
MTFVIWNGVSTRVDGGEWNISWWLGKVETKDKKTLLILSLLFFPWKKNTVSFRHSLSYSRLFPILVS